MEKKGRGWLHLTIAVVFCGMLILNMYTPFIADDYQFKLIFPTTVPVNSVSDIITSLKNLYFNWTGRLVAHSIAFTFLQGDKLLFNLLNSVVFTGLIFLICKHITGNKKVTSTLFLAITAMAWFFFPAFGETVLWLTGAANYLWTTFIILLFLLPYRLQMEQNDYDSQRLKSAGMFLFGIIAGWTSENTAGAMILLVFTFIAFHKINKIDNPKWAFTGCIGAIIGFGAMLIAPGNQVRASSLAVKKPFMEQLVSRLKEILLVTTTGIDKLLIVVVLATGIYFVLKMYKRQDAAVSASYLIAGAATIGAGILCPSMPLRAYFGAVCYLIVASGFVVNEIITLFLNSKKRKSVIIVILCIAMIPSFLEAYKDISHTYSMMEYRQKNIQLEKKIGNTNITVVQIKALSKYNPLYGLGDLQRDKNYWMNQEISKFYGLQSIIGVDENDYASINNLETELEAEKRLPERETVKEMYQGMILDSCNGINMLNQGTIPIKREADVIELYGWAADFSKKLPLKNIRILINNKTITGTYGKPTPDAADYYKNQALSNTGFYFKIDKKLLQNANEISFVLVGSDGAYKYKPVVYQIQWLPK